jgi:hypothetical protein
MVVQFKGGPWHGVRINTRSLPDQVRLQSLDAVMGDDVRLSGDFPADVCYWLRTPYNRDVYYEYGACCALPSSLAALTSLSE